MNIRHFYKLPILLALGLLISACSGSSDTPSKSDDVTADIRGSVGDGPIVNATITIRDNNGIVQETVYSDGQLATYQTNFSLQEHQYPLTLMAEGGIDLVTDMEPDFILYSVATNPSASKSYLIEVTSLYPSLFGENVFGVTITLVAGSFPIRYWEFSKPGVAKPDVDEAECQLLLVFSPS